MQAINRLLRKIVIVTHIFSDVPQLNITNFSQLSLKDLSVALLITSSFYIVQFSRFALPTAFAARFEDPSFAGSSNPTTNLLFGGPEWARTTDLTIISRTL